jgi:hypothetical protein
MGLVCAYRAVMRLLRLALARDSDILEDAVVWRRGGASLGPCRLIEGTAACGTRGTLCVPEILYAGYRHPLRTAREGGPCTRALDCKVERLPFIGVKALLHSSLPLHTYACTTRCVNLLCRRMELAHTLPNTPFAATQPTVTCTAAVTLLHHTYPCACTLWGWADIAAVPQSKRKPSFLHPFSPWSRHIG